MTDDHMYQDAGLWWPVGIKPTAVAHAINRRDRAFAAMEQFMPPPTQRGLVVTAGGMNGLWSLEYAKRGWDRVITFEPAPHVWPCLTRNCLDWDGTIYAHHAALGAEPGVSRIRVNEVGSSYLTQDPQAPSVRVVALDSLGLRVDWLQLDLEGYEYPALVGAAETIAAHRPVVQIECNGQAQKRFAWPDERAAQVLTGLGYRVAAHIPGSDVIWVPS